MGHEPSKLKETPQISSAMAQRGLPTHLNVTLKKSMTKVVCLLSEPDSEPSYAVDLPQGFWGPMIFHGGPSQEHPALATVKDENKWGTKFAVTLPESQKEGVESRHETVKWEAKVKKERFWFGLCHGQQREKLARKGEKGCLKGPVDHTDG